MLARFGSAALRLAIPGVCGLCGGPGQWDRCRAGLDLCIHCEAALPWAGTATAPGVLVAFDYRPPVDFMIRQLKFAGDRGFARTLGLFLAERRLALDRPLPQVIVPVPLHRARLRERGFNQAGELARFAGRGLGVPVRANALTRLRATLAQSGLAASARRDNVRGCFGFDAGEARRIRGARCALVDDVITTGSTAREAAGVLLALGAAEIEIWAAASASRSADEKKGGGSCDPPPQAHERFTA